MYGEYAIIIIWLIKTDKVNLKNAYNFPEHT